VGHNRLTQKAATHYGAAIGSHKERACIRAICCTCAGADKERWLRQCPTRTRSLRRHGDTLHTHTHTHKQHFRLLRRGIFARRVALHGHNRARPRRRASASTACHETTSAKCLNTQRQRPLAPEQPSGPVSPDVAPCQRPNSRREPRPRGEPSQHTASHASLVAAVTLLETGCE